jgi:hypothetical protein
VKRLFAEKGIDLKRIERISPSLEDVFLHLIEDTTKADGGSGQ